MKRLTIQDILRAVNGRLLSGSGSRTVGQVVTDSRDAGPDCLFVPLIGETHDAHRFIPGAYANGCRAFLLSDAGAVPDAAACPAPGGAQDAADCILVPDTLKALGDLAAYCLDEIGPKKAAVTGSVGKTTTRDMLYYVCAEKYRTGRPQKNYNNEIGVPLTVFGLDPDVEAVVFEEGTEMPGTIRNITRIVRPDVAVITNIGISHIENLGSRENILREKLDVTSFFGEENVLVLNASNDLLRTVPRSAPYRIVTCGTDGSADYAVKDIRDLGTEGIAFTLVHEGRDIPVRLHVPGAHNALNAALAAAAGEALGVPLEDAVRGLGKFELSGKRLKIRRSGDVMVIDDSYNAAPDSMRAAIDTLCASELPSGAGRRVAILADMKELGPDAASYHYGVGVYAAEQGVDCVITVGELATEIARGAREKGGPDVFAFQDREALEQRMPALIRKGDAILVKGSNAMHMDQVADRIVGVSGRGKTAEPGRKQHEGKRFTEK